MLALHIRKRCRPIQCRRAVVALGLLCIGLLIPAPQPAVADERPGKQQIDRWVRDLGSKQFSRRTAATKALIRAGKPAIPAVTSAASSDDREKRTRALQVLLTLVRSRDAATVAAAEGGLSSVARSQYADTSVRAKKVLVTIESSRLRGLWEITSARTNGEPSRGAVGRQVMFLNGAVFSQHDDPAFGPHCQGVPVELHPAATPRKIKLRNFACAYGLKDSRLTICIPKRPTEVPPQKLESKRGDGRRLIVLKKIPTRNTNSKVHLAERAAQKRLKTLKCEFGAVLRPGWLSGLLSPTPPHAWSIEVFGTSYDWLVEHHGYLVSIRLKRPQHNDAALRELRYFPDLNEVTLVNSKVADRHVRSLSVVKALKSLNVNCTDITDACAADIAKHKQLVDLNLSQTEVTDRAMPQISKCRELKRLKLWGCKLTDAAVAHLLKLKQLRRLDVSGTQISDNGIRRLRSGLPKCAIKK